MVNVDKTKSEMAEAKRLADEAQSGFSSSGNVRSKDAYGRDKLFMPAAEAGASKGKQAEAAKLWNEKGTDSPFFRKWFGKSKVVDENGEPLVVYHGTSQGGFTSFDRSKAGVYGDLGMRGKGFYFTDSKGLAKLYEEGHGKPITKKQTYEVFLKLENPYDANLDPLKVINSITDKKKLTERLKQEGFDGVDYTYGYGQREIVAFSPEQIKSATGNRGTFDAGDPNMLYMPAAEAGASKGKEGFAAELWRKKGTDSPLFRRWFGRSKTLEYQGIGKTPLPWIHHGSLGQGGPESMIPKGSIWLSQPDPPGLVGRVPTGHADRGPMTQLYARANKIWDWRKDAHLNALAKRISAEAEKNDFQWDAENWKEVVRDEEGSAAHLNDFVSDIKALGFDAAQIGSRGELVIFDAARNVKSADNRGTFLPSNESILFMPAESKGQRKKILLRTKQEISDAVDSLAAERGISRNDALNELLNSALLDPKMSVGKRSEGDITLALTPEEIALLEKTEIGPEGSADYKAAIAKRRAISEREIGVKNRLYMPAAYHGTPHTFKAEEGAPLGRFRSAQIGTGEGAQAYGHGLYFAGRKEVGNYYRDALTSDNLLTVKKNGKIIAQGDGIDAVGLDAVKYLEAGERRAGEFKHNKAYYAKKATSDPKVISKIEEWKDAEISYERPKGSLYKVELAPKENEYLLWGKPLSEQPKGVREKLEEVMGGKSNDLFQTPLRSSTDSTLDAKGHIAFLKLKDSTDGARFYNGLSTALKGGGAASAALKEAGIPGIKYLDGSSRSKGKGDYNYVIFDEADVAITDKLFMPADRALGLSDNIRDEVLPGIKQDKFSRGQLEAALLKSAGSKAYAEEIGLMDWLKDRKSVTMAEVDQFVRENAPRLEEKVLGEAELTGKELPEGWNITPSIPSTRPSGRAFPPKWEITNQHGRVVWDHPKTVSLDEALALFEKSEAVDMTKFSGYQEPGGTNYREVLVKLPEKSANNSEIQALRQDVQSILEKRQALEAEGKYGESNALSPEMDARQARIQKLQSQDNFRDPHFQEDNVLLHLRLNDRIDANGKKVLFIEELQSDWHQKGRKDGYAGFNKKDYKIERNEAGSWNVIRLRDGEVVDVVAGKATAGANKGEAITLERAWEIFENAVGAGILGGVPDAPFKKNWPALGLKRAIREALENGYDRVAWLDGEGQAARYDLSKHIDEVEVIYDSDSRDLFHLSAWKDQRNIFNRGQITAEEVSSLVGKELGGRAIKDLSKQKDPKFAEVKYSGLDLKVGGEGMKAFYDRELVSIANKISKKIGGGKVRREIIEMDWLRPAGQPDGVQISSHVLDLPKNPQAVENLRLYMPAQKAPSDSRVPTILKDAKGAKALVQPRAIESGFETENINAPKFVDKVLDDLKVDVQRTNFEKPEVNLADHYGKNALITMTDRTPTDHVIYGINDVQFKTPLRLEGGRDYMFDSAHSPGAAWANEQGAMTAMLNRRGKLGGEDMLVIPMEMAPTSVDFPTMAPALHIRYAQVAMKSKDKRYVNSLVKKGGKGFLTKSQDQVKVPKFDIDMENVEAFLSKLSGPQRKTINNVFDMVNRPSSAQKGKGVRQIDGALSNFEMRAAISDPAMFNQKSLMQTTNVGLMTGGQAPSMHSTYNAAMKGKGLGVLKVPEGFQPKAQDFLPDLFKKSNKDYVHPNDAYTTRMGVRTTKIDDALLKRLGL